MFQCIGRTHFSHSLYSFRFNLVRILNYFSLSADVCPFRETFTAFLYGYSYINHGWSIFQLILVVFALEVLEVRSLALLLASGSNMIMNDQFKLMVCATQTVH